MNSSAAVLRGTIPTECVMYKLLGGKLDDTTPEAYTVLVFLVVISIITCPACNHFVERVGNCCCEDQSAPDDQLQHCTRLFSSHRWLSGSSYPTHVYCHQIINPARRNFLPLLHPGSVNKKRDQTFMCGVNCAHGFHECGAILSYKTLVHLYNDGHQGSIILA